MIHIALPALCEQHLRQWVLNLCLQSVLPERVWICVNQPSSFIDSTDLYHSEAVRVNKQCLKDLHDLKKNFKLPFILEIIDKSSPGKAFEGKKSGVGWARKIALDAANSMADENDLLLCMDADTQYPRTYIESICALQTKHPTATGIAGAYYHPIPKGIYAVQVPEEQIKAMLHYEVYMRMYSISLLLTNHPYAFTAIGSSMACPAWAYRKIGGITPYKSGEDFYFLQKLAKCGEIVNAPTVAALPSARLSGRVIFGTGPAIAMGIQNKWDSCPLYPLYLFEQMRRFYSSLDDILYTNSKAVLGGMGTFVSEKWGNNWSETLKKNSKDAKTFKRACIHKVDALRCLQFLKASYKYNSYTDASNLYEILVILKEVLDTAPNVTPNVTPNTVPNPAFNPAPSLINRISECSENIRYRELTDITTEQWSKIRNILYACERKLKIANETRADRANKATN